MRFSMNGFRRNLSGDIESLRHIAELIINDDSYDKDAFVEVVNSIISHSNMINCISDPDDPDFSELTDIEVKYLGT